MLSRGSAQRAGRADTVPGERQTANKEQKVCVGLSEPSAVPRICSILIFSCCDFSSLGKRTPTPCVRLPEARAGVIHATLPATG